MQPLLFEGIFLCRLQREGPLLALCHNQGQFCRRRLVIHQNRCHFWYVAQNFWVVFYLEYLSLSKILGCYLPYVTPRVSFVIGGF